MPRDLTVTDTLPAGVTFTGFDGSTAPWNCGHNSGTITCTHAGEYPVAGYANMQAIRFKASVAAGGTPGTQLVNQGVIGVAPGLNEPNTTNNTASAAVDFSNDARLRLAKAGPGRPVLAGQEFEYTITVTNTGPMPVLPNQQITVTDNPADGRMAIVSMSGAGTGAGSGPAPPRAAPRPRAWPWAPAARSRSGPRSRWLRAIWTSPITPPLA